MTLAEVYTMLKKTGYPVAYHHFIADEKNSAPTPPYILYLIPYSTNFGADNKVYHKINHCQIELYTNKKDQGAEQVLENVLDDASIFYDKVETYIESEKLYQVIYEISI